MKLISAAALLLLFAAPAFCQTVEQTPQQIEATSELAEGARAYKAGWFDDAQRHFERALELDPSNKNTPFFIARAIHARFKPGNEMPENVAVARAAIDAYRRVLNAEPSHDEAYNAIIYLYSQVKDEAAAHELLMMRATDTQAPAAKRAQAYTLMASREWNCSYRITERKEHKNVIVFSERAMTKYIKPKDEAEFNQAKQCAKQGLELVGQAINLDANSAQAWSYKTNLLLELVKLAEMEENELLKVDYQKQAAEAQRRTTELSEPENKKTEAQSNQSPPL